jgi:hypothetical protein
MKIRIAATVGAFAVGYAVGTATGRRQARQLAQLAGRAGRSVPVTGTANFVGDKATAAAHLTLEWMKDVAGTALGWRNGDEAADAIVIDLAEELAQAINGYGHSSGDSESSPGGSGSRREHLSNAAGG